MTGDGAGGFLGLGGVDWIAYIIVAGFQIGLFLMGIEWVGKFPELGRAFRLSGDDRAGADDLVAGLGMASDRDRDHLSGRRQRSQHDRGLCRRGRHHGRLFRGGGDQFRRFLSLS